MYIRRRWKWRKKILKSRKSLSWWWCYWCGFGHKNERKFVLVNEREHLGFEYKDILTLFVSPVKMIPLASRRISPVVNMKKVLIKLQLFLFSVENIPCCSWPVIQAAWCGNKRLIRMRPGYGADESIPPDTERPKPPGPFAISTLNVQSRNRERREVN